MLKKNSRLLCLASILLLLIASWLGANNQVRKSENLNLELYEIKTNYIVHTLGVQDQHLVHLAVSNRINHHLNYLEGEQFVIFLPNQKILASEFLVTKVDPSPTGLSFEMKHPGTGILTRLDFQASESGAVVEKKLMLVSERDRKLLKKICLFDNKVGTKGEFTTFPGPGQPAYKDNLFFAIIYPLSEVKTSGVHLKICYQPDQWLDQNGYLSHTAILGVSEPDQTEKWFMKYLDEIRHRKPEPYLLYNSWYDLPGIVNTKDILKAIQDFKTHLTDPYGIKLDAVVIDDGWDDPKKLWQFDMQKFPDGIAPVKSAAESIGAKPGMWFSPAGGYGDRKYKRILGTLGQGYEKNWLSLNLVRNGYCPAGEKYHQEFQKRILEETRFGVSYFKLDNIGTTCFIPWHNHPPGKLSKTAITEALIEIMDQAHQINPEVFFNITVGTWLSPFWLKWADCVWMGGMDYGFSGPGSKREKNITYKDQNLYRIFREQKLQFPINGIMTHGLIKGKYQFPETGPIEEFERDVIMYLGRGVSMWELYLSPEILTEQEWEVLARWLNWAKQNWAILKNTKMVLGNPNQLEIYGYLHQKDNQALLIARNPLDNPQSLILQPESLGLKNFRTITQIYPETLSLNASSSLSFSSFQVRVIKFEIGE